MSLLVGLENNFEGRSLAWALDYPGCFAYGRDSSSALSVMPTAFTEYQRWIAAHNPSDNWGNQHPTEFQVVDTWKVYSINGEYDLSETGDYEVNAWFRHDWKPLSSTEIQRALLLLEWSRIDLLQTVLGLDPARLEVRHPGERWNIAGILTHLAGAEWWYLDRLDLGFPREQVPVEPFERLLKVRNHLRQVLPGLAGVNKVLGVDGEFWSPRKLVRRVLWHERDHTNHILRLR